MHIICLAVEDDNVDGHVIFQKKVADRVNDAADFKGVRHGLACCGVQRRAWLPAAGQRLPGRCV